ncbi:MAG: type II CRISPR RNA-guided endonuclease Cas9 [Bacteroidales bacterium]|nr:type II CRISPR RNA-guided endonuclease Cas9 [Bacteroidales bacterium]
MKILGLDLGVTSIGWALIEKNNENGEIDLIKSGVRIIPIDAQDAIQFNSGNTASPNIERRKKRMQRRMYFRKKKRNQSLIKTLLDKGLWDESLINIEKNKLWELRNNALNEQISLSELGRILYHLAQRRGYKQMRIEQDESDANSKSDYKKNIDTRYKTIKNENITVGQYFYRELKNNEHYRVKEQIFPRKAYEEEFEKIISKQKEYYPDILSEDFVNKIQHIIFYQRPLKSQKHLLGVCTLEGKTIKIKNNDGSIIEKYVGPPVVARTNPLFQIHRIWQTINNITIKNKKTYKMYELSIDEKNKIFNELQVKDSLSIEQLYKILNLSKDEWYFDKLSKNGIKGNDLLALIRKALKDEYFSPDIFKLDIKIINYKQQILDKSTGEIKETTLEMIDPNVVNEPLYKLWHILYSVVDKEECIKALKKNFNFSSTAADKLSDINMTSLKYGSLSMKAIRKTLPYLMKGMIYSEACQIAGYNFSNAISKDENYIRPLKNKIPLLPKNSLRQPIVEKILNQMIHVVNEIIDENNGLISREERENNNFAIHIELARELKTSKKEKQGISNAIKRNTKENKEIENILKNEYKLTPTRKLIEKYKLYKELSPEGTNILQQQCIYCGEFISLTDALTGDAIDVDHIIPQSKLFDDSRSNKILVHANCNRTKGNMTAYDYMQSKGQEQFKTYLALVEKLKEKKSISYKKYKYLLMSEKDIPQDFIDRDLRISQYITRKASEICMDISKDVLVTTGTITARLRELWGYKDIISEINTELMNNIELSDENKSQLVEIFENKRSDHRHHAIDAITIASTSRSIIQRINTLSSAESKEKINEYLKQLNQEILDTVYNPNEKNLRLLHKYLANQPHPSREQVKQSIKDILISFKPGKKVATYSKRIVYIGNKPKILQTRILTPRGALHEESYYGRIALSEFKDLKYAIDNVNLVVNNHIRSQIMDLLEKYNNDTKKLWNDIKKEKVLIYSDINNTNPIKDVKCYKYEYVIKKPITEDKVEQKAIDKKIKEILSNRKNKKEEIYFNEVKKIPIHRVRVSTGLDNKSIRSIRYNANGEPITFVKPANNHHVALYKDKNEKYQEHLCNFWHAVERKKYNLPIIIEHPDKIWDHILEEPDKYPQDFLNNLPDPSWDFVFSFQANEMFILGLSNEEFDQYINDKNYAILSNHLYRVQKISSSYYSFRKHSDTSVDEFDCYAKINMFKRVRSINALIKENPIKVRINYLGEIVDYKKIF